MSQFDDFRFQAELPVNAYRNHIDIQCQALKLNIKFNIESNIISTVYIIVLNI